MSALRDAVRSLEQALGLPVLVIASSWRPGAEVNLDERALPCLMRALDALDTLDALRGASQGTDSDSDTSTDSDPTASEDAAPDASPLAVCLIARGGDLAWCDGARRALASRARVCALPALARGPAALLALSLPALLMGPQGALGAYDVGALGPTYAPPQAAAELWPLLPYSNELELFEPERRAALALAVALRRRQRALARQLLTRSPHHTGDLEVALSAEHLGESLGLDAQELSALGVQASQAHARAARALRDVYTACAHLLRLEQPLGPRYTPSAQLADEVEFELATTQPGALIALHDCVHLFEQDTGRPDPDTGLLDGRWLHASWADLS